MSEMQTYHDAGFKSEMSRPKFVTQVKNSYPGCRGTGVSTGSIAVWNHRSRIRAGVKVPQ